MTPTEIREANLKILEGYPDPIKRRACRSLIEAYEALDALDDGWYALETIVSAAEECLPPDLNAIFYDTTHPDEDDEEEED